MFIGKKHINKMIDILIKVGSFLVDVFKEKHSFTEDETERIYSCLSEIAELLDEVAYDLEAGDYPHGKCAQMDLLSKYLYNELNGKISEEYLHLLVDNLNYATELEKLYAYKGDPEKIKDIEKAAGYFRAAGVLATL